MLLPWILLAALAGDDLQPTDACLRAFVAGTATYEIQAKFHEEFPHSPHKHQAEEYEAAVHCLLADDRLGDVGTRALADVFLARLKDEAVPALVAAAGEEDWQLAMWAVEGLGLFGNRPGYDWQAQFAGKPVMVLYPPAPDPRATAALLGIAGDPAHARRAVAIRVLGSHDTEEAEAFARRLALSRRGAEAGAGRDLLHDLIRWRDVPTLAEMAAAEEPAFRAVAARALGRKPERAAVVTLLGLLADQSAEVRVAAHESLHLLSPDWQERSGGMPEPALLRKEWARVFGPEGERFDPEKAIRPWPVAPGIYR